MMLQAVVRVASADAGMKKEYQGRFRVVIVIAGKEWEQLLTDAAHNFSRTEGFEDGLQASSWRV